MSIIASVLVFAGSIPMTFNMRRAGQLFALGVMMDGIQERRAAAHLQLPLHFGVTSTIAAADDLSSCCSVVGEIA